MMTLPRPPHWTLCSMGTGLCLSAPPLYLHVYKFGAQLICAGSGYIQSKPCPEMSICFHPLPDISELLCSGNLNFPLQPIPRHLLSSGCHQASRSPNVVLPTLLPPAHLPFVTTLQLIPDFCKSQICSFLPSSLFWMNTLRPHQTLFS